jgi:hypothetical protein
VHHTGQEVPDDTGVLKSVASFAVPANLCPGEAAVKYRSKNTPVAMTMARRIAAGLAERGHCVSEVGTGSGGAGFACRLDRACEITVFLEVERREGDSMCFYLITWQSSSLNGRFLGRGASTPDCDKRWSTLCRAINNVLEDTLEASLWFGERRRRIVASYNPLCVIGSVRSLNSSAALSGVERFRCATREAQTAQMVISQSAQNRPGFYRFPLFCLGGKNSLENHPIPECGGVKLFKRFFV